MAYKERGKIFSIHYGKSKKDLKETVKQSKLLEGFGLEGDAHGGPGTRQVSLLSIESIREQTECPKIEKRGLCLGPGDFSENITTEGLNLSQLRIGDRLNIGRDAILQISKIGRECHKHCSIYSKMSDCIIPREGLFAMVLHGGTISVDDIVEVIKKEGTGSECNGEKNLKQSFSEKGVPKPGVWNREEKQTPTAVVALGGNAITRESEDGNITQQFANTRRSLVGVVDLIRDGYHVVLTHGNGPQIGNYMIRVESARDQVPTIPLGVAVADTEGGMGYMIEQSLQNMLHRSGMPRKVATLLTQVIVDRNDPSILKPDKFIGPFYSASEAKRLAEERGWPVQEDAGRGWRRVVPSPKPIEIVEKEFIRKLMLDGVIMIACGGGGIPVYIEDDGTYEGVDGVIDKDLASAVLARDVAAEELYILTSVEKVALRYKQPGQLDLDRLTVRDARSYLEQGEFPAGSMAPKIQAAVIFLEGGGRQVIITSIEKLSDARKGRTGTRIVFE